MNKRKRLSTLFYLRTDRKKDGLCPLYLRITVNGECATINTNRFTKVDNWNSKKQLSKSEEINDYIKLITSKIYDAQKKFLFENKELTANAIKKFVLGENEENMSL